MKAYRYNETTKEFELELNAQIDPLESNKQGKSIYLLPANSTFEKHLARKEGYTVVWDNGWQYIEDHRGQKIINSQGINKVNYLGELKEGDVLIDDEKEEKILNGELIYIEGKLIEKPLETLKEEKKAEINDARDLARKTEGAEYDSDIFDVDEVSQSNILAQIKVAELLKSTEATYIYRSKTNKDHLLTVAELQELGLVIAQKVNEIYKKSWDLKAEVDKAQTAEEVKAIQWTSV